MGYSSGILGNINEVDPILDASYRETGSKVREARLELLEDSWELSYVKYISLCSLLDVNGSHFIDRCKGCLVFARLDCNFL